jgi:nicotinamide mononucleotide transporter
MKGRCVLFLLNLQNKDVHLILAQILNSYNHHKMDFRSILSALSAMPLLEISAVLCGLIYIVLAAREKVWCWPFGILNSLLSIVLFYQSKLYAESVLYIYYVAAGLYGWYSWNQGWKKNEQLAVRSWPWQKHLPGLFANAVLGLGMGYILEHFTDALYPWVDAQITVFSFWATYLSTRKVLENWLYWIIIDSISIYICWSRELPFYAFLMLVYSIMAGYGWKQWRKA